MDFSKFSSIYSLGSVFELFSIGLSFLFGKWLSSHVHKKAILHFKNINITSHSSFFFYLMTFMTQLVMLPIFSFGFELSSSLIQFTLLILVALMLNTLLKNSVLKIFVSFFIWSFFLLYITGLLQPVFTYLSGTSIRIGSTTLNLLGILKAIGATTILISAALAFANYLDRRLQKQKQLAISAKLILSKTVKTFLLSFSVFIGLSLFGIDLSVLSFFAGALGVGIAFSLQNILSNFFSGFILLVDRSIKPGDVISINNGQIYGVVNKLHARYVSLRTREGKEHLIPNQEIISSKLENWSYSDTQIRVETAFRVSIHSDLYLVEKLLKEIALSANRVAPKPAPTIRFRSLLDNGVDLLLRYWISDPENGISDVRSEIILKAWKAFQENGIQVPIPPREIYPGSADPQKTLDTLLNKSSQDDTI